jgi:hypothetical protein
MSEKPSAREMRAMGAHPEKRRQTPLTEGARRPLASGPGFFDEPGKLSEEVEASVIVPASKESGTDLVPRQLKFLKGTRLYKVVRDGEGKPIIPRTEKQEDKLFDRSLTHPTFFDLPVGSLQKGARGGTTVRKFGQSKYGAFTIVLVPVTKESGETVLDERLASLTTRSSQKNP